MGRCPGKRRYPRPAAVILPPATWNAWLDSGLDSEPGEARAILDEAPEADLEYYPMPKRSAVRKTKDRNWSNQPPRLSMTRLRSMTDQ